MNSQSGSTHDAARGLGGLYSVQLPPHLPTLAEVRRMIADKGVRLDETADLACADPVIVLSLLRTSNSMAVSSGRPPASTMKAALERLGAEETIRLLDMLNSPVAFGTEQIAFWFEEARTRCRRVSKVSRILADVVSRSLAEDCEAAASLLHLGELLMVAHFKDVYVRVADSLKVRTKIIYRMEKDFHFSTANIGVTYLRRAGIPENVLFAIDEHAQTKSPSRAVTRPICESGSEVVLAAEANKFDKLKPGGAGLGPKSALRTLKITDAQYEQFYHTAREYLHSQKLVESD